MSCQTGKESVHMKPIRLEQWLEFQFLSALQANPGRTRLAYLAAKAVEDKNEYHHQLHVYDTRSRKIINLKNDNIYVWENDDVLLFHLARTKQEEKDKKENKFSFIYRHDLTTGTTTHAATLPVPLTLVKVLDSGQWLLSGQLKPEHHRLYQVDAEARKAELKSIKREEPYEDIDEIGFYYNGTGFTAGVRQQLFLYDPSSKKIEPLMASNFHMAQYRISNDMQKIYYTGKIIKDIKPLTHDVYVYDVLSKTTHKLLENDTHAISRLLLINDRLIICASDMKEYGLNQNHAFHVLENGELKLFSAFDQAIGNSVGSDVRLGTGPFDSTIADTVYFVSTVDDHTDLMSLDAKGNITSLLAFKGSIDGLAFMHGKPHVIGLYQQRLQEMYQLDLDTKRVKMLTRHNQKALKDHYVAKPQPLILKQDTHDVKGFALLPKDVDKTRTYPVILDIHGGPKTVYGTVYYHEMQVWANMGYIVLFANPRGSDGKGNAFADIRGQYGMIDYEDLMRFLDLAITQMPMIDQDRLFVTGGSYGGFMTNWMVGHTRRFKAAATQRSITNWISFHGTSDIGFYFTKDQNAAHPVTDAERLWLHSPLKYVDAMETPLLIIHADQDYRCPIEQAMQLFTLLKEKGVPTRFIWFKGENHELSRGGKPQARNKRLREITQWFDTYR
ncbi:MAG: S9 family peptidase [Acholeplasmataceae bacterium]|nr:MAG: S9 family peptidase [Acholeplasmataceae bacterium]